MPFQLGELSDELRCLVRLGETSRLERRLTAAECLDELRQALRLVGERPGAREERDRSQVFRQRVDADLHVALERERRVLEPPLDDVLDPRANRLRLAAVGDEREAVLTERKGTNVRLDRRLDDPEKVCAPHGSG